LEAGLWRGLATVWWVPPSLSYSFWFLPRLTAISLEVCCLHFVRALPSMHSLCKVHSRLDYDKARGRLPFEHWQNAAISPDQRQPESCTTFEKLQIGMMLSPRKYSWMPAQASKL
jgi:hypothetical protein